MLLKLQVLAQFLLLGSFTSFLAEAYYIDASCKTPALKVIIEEGMTNAFDMARMARNEILRKPWTTPNRLPYADLGDWVVHDRGSTPYAPGVMNLDIAVDAYRGILTQHRKVDPKPSPPANLAVDVEVFCNLDRFIKTSIPGRFWNKATKSFVSVFGWKILGSPPPIAMCMNPRRSDTGMVKAVTGKPPGASNEHPWELQLCPDYLDAVLHAGTNTGRHVRTPLTAINDPNGITHMDLFAMFDATLLHELAHALAGARHSVEHYGWNNIKAFALASPEQSIRNADTLAYLALGIRLLNLQSLTPHQDGSVT